MTIFLPSILCALRKVSSMTKDAKILLSAMSALVFSFAISLLGSMKLITKNIQGLLNIILLIAMGAYVIHLSLSDKGFIADGKPMSRKERYIRTLPATIMLGCCTISQFMYMDVISRTTATILNGLLLLALAAQVVYVRRKDGRL